MIDRDFEDIAWMHESFHLLGLGSRFAVSVEVWCDPNDPCDVDERPGLTREVWWCPHRLKARRIRKEEIARLEAEHAAQSR